MNLPQLAAFRFFNTAAQTQSFVKAAQQLHVTHGAVSRQVRLLEETIGVELFERRNRAIFLNHAGRLLFNVTGPLFEQLEGAVYRLQQEVQNQVLVVSCEPTIAMKWLIPRLPDFHKACPHVQVQLLTAGGPIDFARSGANLAIRRDDFHWDATVHTVTICEEWIGPVCIPAKAADGLQGACLLRSKTRPLAWDNWLRLAEMGVPHSSRVDYEHFYLCIQAALAGLGIGMASFLMVQDELASGQLSAPFGFIQDGSTYCLLSPRPFESCANSMAFKTWLTQAMSVCSPHIAPQPLTAAVAIDP